MPPHILLLEAACQRACGRYVVRSLSFSRVKWILLIALSDEPDAQVGRTFSCDRVRRSWCKYPFIDFISNGNTGVQKRRISLGSTLCGFKHDRKFATRWQFSHLITLGWYRMQDGEWKTNESMSRTSFSSNRGGEGRDCVWSFQNIRRVCDYFWHLAW